MEILYKNDYNFLRGIVETKAKYQKVLLIYDDAVSNAEIRSLYESVKELCVYNQLEIKSLNINEIYNGYKIIIYLCSTDNFLKINFNNEEFINIFIPTDNGILPYYLNVDNKINSSNNYLILTNNTIDINLLISIYFNNFFNYLKNILLYKNCNFNFDFLSTEITRQNCINLLESLSVEFEFKDIDLLKSLDISYEDLQTVDLILIDAFLVLIEKLKTHSYMLADAYKIAKNDIEMIDKIYASATNESVKEIINLNYGRLYSACKKTKEKILELYNISQDLDFQYINEIIEKIKNYTKNDKEILFYLYLYNIFEN